MKTIASESIEERKESDPYKVGPNHFYNSFYGLFYFSNMIILLLQLSLSKDQAYGILYILLL